LAVVVNSIMENPRNAMVTADSIYCRVRPRTIVNRGRRMAPTRKRVVLLSREAKVARVSAPTKAPRPMADVRNP